MSVPSDSTSPTALSIPDEDLQELFAETLREYAKEAFSSQDGEAFLNRCEQDEAFRSSMILTLSQMSDLVAYAAEETDERFSQIRKKTLFDSRHDNDEAFKMRSHYLSHRKSEDLRTLTHTPEQTARFDQRLDSFYEDFNTQHQFRG